MKYEGFEALLRSRAADFAERPALLFAQGGEIGALSYAELLDQVLRRRDELKREPFSCAAIYSSFDVDWVVTMFACVLAGKRTVLLDVSQSPEAASALIRYTEADWLYCSEPDDREALSPSLAAPCKPAQAQEEGRLLFFTSGTTEFNKAVVLSTRALCSSAWNGQAMLPCRETDVLLAMLPPNHVFGFVCSLLWPLSQGAAVALGRGMRYFTQDPGFFKPNILPAVPSLIKYLCAMKALNPELHTVLIGASPCDAQTLQTVRESGVDLRFGYGLTETASGLAISLAGEDPLAMALCPDTQLRIAEDGEILVRTSCMMEGYYKNEAATNAVLKDGELSTGDLGRLDEQGRLRITGRKKDVLILENGTKVYLNEWEQSLSALLNTETAVLLKDGRLTLAAVGSEDKRELFWEKIRWFNGTQSFDRQIAALMLLDEALPRTATGKLKRWAI